MNLHSSGNSSGKIYQQFLYLILITSICILGIFGYTNRKSREKVCAENDSLKNALKVSESTLSNYREVIDCVWKYEKMRLEVDSIYVLDEVGNRFCLKKIISPNRLFVRISTENCWPCVKFINDYIVENCNKADVVFLIQRHDNDMAYKAFKMYTKIKAPAYFTRELLNIPMEEYNEPFIFSVDQHSEIIKFLKPIRDDCKLMDTYFQNVKSS